MRTLVLLAILLPQTARAATPCRSAPKLQQPCLPRIEQRQEVMDLIDETVARHQAWIEVQGVERKLRNAIRKGQSIDYEKWEKSLADVQKLRTSLDESFAKTAAAAEKNFHVGPDSRSGNVHGGLFEGDRAQWKPTLGTEETYFKVERPKKPPVYMHFENKETANEVTLGQLLDDGRVVISIHALQLAAKSRNPVDFAATLEHEGVHFDRLLSPDGMVGHAQNETAAYQRVLDVAGDIGLSTDHVENSRRQVARHLGDVTLQAVESHFGPKPYRAQSGTEDYPYVPAPDTYFKGWAQYQTRLEKIENGQKKLSADIAAVRGGADRGILRDALNDRRAPPPGAAANDGCSSPGFWAGDVYMPPTPCARILPPPTSTEAVPAAPSVPITPVTLPPPVRTVPSLLGLAERICANPTAAHSQSFHDDYRAAWYASNDDGATLSKCAGEVFRTLKRIRQEGYSDYNSAYFQSLAENLNMPQPPVFEPPQTEIDLPVPAGPGTRDCLRADGRRCIRWR